MFEFNSPKSAHPVQREPLFSLDGVVGSIPIKFTATDAMAYMNAVRNYGPEAAVSWALEYALSNPTVPDPGKAYRALLDAPEGAVPDDELERMIQIVIDRIMGRKAVIPEGKDVPKGPAEEDAEPSTGSKNDPETMSGA